MVVFKNKRRIDLTGKVYGRLTVIEPGPDTRRPSGRLDNSWVCKCDCGKMVTVLSSNLRGNTKSCGCLNFDRRSERFKGNTYSYDLQKKGTKNIKLTYFKMLKMGADKRNLEFNITIEYIQELLEKQNFKCALTGIDIVMDHKNTRKRIGICGTNTASVDRIDSSKGYIIGNIQWVHKDINSLKSNFEEKVFIEWCKKVSSYNS